MRYAGSAAASTGRPYAAASSTARAPISSRSCGGSRTWSDRPIESSRPGSFVERFLERRGEGIHHLSLEIDALDPLTERLEADGVRIVDVLNDFDLTETGRYRLPNLQAGSPLDIVVQLKVGAEEIGTQMRLLDLRLGFTPQDAKNAEVLKQAHTVEFATHLEMDSSPVNHEVIKAVQFLMNARARNEAMKRMDQGDYAGAQDVLVNAVSATRVACASFASMPAVMEELAALQETTGSLTDRLKDKMSRKKLAYGAYSRRTGK